MLPNEEAIVLASWKEKAEKIPQARHTPANLPPYAWKRSTYSAIQKA
jgi:hypothetical protein